jgi:RNA polymerase sigma-70 factor (ECF subfamily)
MNEPENGPLPSLLHEHADWVARLSRALVYRDEAEDIAQSTWLQLLRSPPPPDCDNKAWIFGVLRRSILKSNDAKRKAARDLELHRRIPTEFYAPSTDDLVDEIALQRAVSGAVLALPEKYREVIVLRYYQDLEPNVIAEKLELPVKTVHTRLRRGREALRNKLDHRFGSRNLWMGLLIPRLPGAKAETAIASSVARGSPGPVVQLGSQLKLLLVASLAVVVPLGLWALTRGKGQANASGPSPEVIVGSGTSSAPQAVPEPSSWLKSAIEAPSPPSPPSVQERDADLRDRIVALLENFTGFDPSMARALDVASLAMEEVRHPLPQPYWDEHGFKSWSVGAPGVTIILAYRPDVGRARLKLTLRLDDDVELPAPFLSASALVSFELVLDETGRELLTGAVDSGLSASRLDEAATNELTSGYNFELRDPAQLELRRSFCRIQPKPASPDRQNESWNPVNDAGQVAVRTLRARFEAVLPVGSGDTVPVYTLPSRIEHALAQISSPSTDLHWLNDLVLGLDDDFPRPEEVVPFLRERGPKAYSIPSIPALHGCWTRLHYRNGEERIVVNLETSSRSMPDGFTNLERDAAKSIDLIARRQGDVYSFFAAVYCDSYSGMKYLLGSDGWFTMQPCKDEEGAFYTPSVESLLKPRLPRQPSQLDPSAAESLWKALDAYLPQLPE